MEKIPSFESKTSYKQEETEKVPKPELREIAELQEPMQNLLEQLKDKINAGEYGLIIGDDASGRIPTLVFSNVINSIYKESDRSKIDTRFIAGSKFVSEDKLDIKKDLIKNYLQKLDLQEEKNKKVLVVTEAILEGKGMKLLADILLNLGLGFDIATVSFLQEKDRTPEKIKEVKKYLGADVYYGATGDIVNLYHNRGISGVHKDPGKLFAEPFKKYLQKDWFTSKKEMKRRSKQTRQARKDAHILSEYLIGWYKKKFLAF